MKGKCTKISTFATCLGMICLSLTGTGLAGTTATTVINLDCTSGIPNRVITVPPNSVTRTMAVMRVAGDAGNLVLSVSLGGNAVFDGASLPVAANLTQTGGLPAGNVAITKSAGGTDGVTFVEFFVEVTADFTTLPTFTLDTSGWTIRDPDNLLAGGGIITITITTKDGNSGNPVDAVGTDTVNWLRIAGGCPIPIADHFLSYQIKHKAEVFLADQFIQGFFTIKEPEALLNPADKDGGGIIDTDTHLVSYKVKGPEFDKVENILVENQFGTFVIDVKKPDRLLVPASKSLIGPVSPPPPDNNTHDVDHFLCYQIEDDDDDNLGILISVVDQFNQPKLFDVKKPRRFCNPVDKNGEGIKNPQTHLMCFSVRRARGEPKHERIDGIFVNDQFGPGRVDTKKERELCVPSTKTLP